MRDLSDWNDYYVLTKELMVIFELHSSSKMSGCESCTVSITNSPGKVPIILKSLPIIISMLMVNRLPTTFYLQGVKVAKSETSSHMAVNIIMNID